MERLTFEIIDGGMVVEKDTITEFEIDDNIPVCGGNAIYRLAEYEDTGLTPEQVRELKEKCNDCSRRKWYQMGYSDGRNCTSDCPYNIGKPCPAAEGCPGYEEKQHCRTCRWYDMETQVCCNGESEHRADFRDWNDWCSKWEDNQ